jgi:hypothetical protein
MTYWSVLGGMFSTIARSNSIEGIRTIKNTQSFSETFWDRDSGMSELSIS